MKIGEIEKIDIFALLPNNITRGLFISRSDEADAHEIPALGTFEHDYAEEIEHIRSLGCDVKIKLGVVINWS